MECLGQRVLKPPPFPHKENVLLADYSTFGIGGPAHFFASIQTKDEAAQAFVYAKSVGLPVFVLGKGSNVLFDDRGFAGLVLLNRIEELLQEGPLWTVGSGFSFVRLGRLSVKRGYSGLEFAAGIPASVGGAIAMNAGALGQETAEVLKSVEFLDERGRVHTLSKEQLSWGYRSSPFQRRRSFILGATFLLTPKDNAAKTQKESLTYRVQTQPYGEKSAGCAFRNPSSSSAGALIEQVGLKGLKQGQILVSPTHANFLINEGGGKARDVMALLETIEERVWQEKQIRLQREIRVIPYDPTISS